MTTEQWTALVTALTPLLIAIGGGAWAAYRYFASRPTPTGPPVAQGQAVELAAYLDDELDEARQELRASQHEARTYRDALLRHGLDPDEILQNATRPR